jgi:hypothetical protein
MPENRFLQGPQRQLLNLIFGRVPINGLTGCDGQLPLARAIRLAKLIAKAFKAGSRRIAHRVRPFAVGSSERVTP